MKLFKIKKCYFVNFLWYNKTKFYVESCVYPANVCEYCIIDCICSKYIFMSMK